VSRKELTSVSVRRRPSAAAPPTRPLLAEAGVEPLGDVELAGVGSGVPADPGHRELSGLVDEVLGHDPTVGRGTGPARPVREASRTAGTRGDTVVDMSISRHAAGSSSPVAG